VSTSCIMTKKFSDNPILPNFNADSSAHVFGDKICVYPSYDIAGSIDWDMTEWHTFSSADLVNWKDHVVIFGLKDIVW